MRRALDIAIGLVIVLVSATVLIWVAYSYTLADEPPKYPWWQAIFVTLLWGYAITYGVARMRGTHREVVDESDDWSG
jgi:hypothetical protein